MSYPQFKVEQIVVGQLDSVGRRITKIYTRRPPWFAIYEVDDGVWVHFADDAAEEEKQRKLLLPLAPLRYEIGSLLYRRPGRERYDVKVAEALILALSGEPVGAERTLAGAKAELEQELAAERAVQEARAALEVASKTTLAHMWYLGTAVVCGMILMGCLFVLSHWIYWDLRSSVSQNVWLAAKAGVIGAWLSVAIGVAGRTLPTAGKWYTIALDSMLRMTVGSVCGGLALLLVASGVFADKPFEMAGNTGWMAVFLLGTIAGFSERFVPDALSTYVAKISRTPKPTVPQTV